VPEHAVVYKSLKIVHLTAWAILYIGIITQNLKPLDYFLIFQERQERNRIYAKSNNGADVPVSACAQKFIYKLRQFRLKLDSSQLAEENGWRRRSGHYLPMMFGFKAKRRLILPFTKSFRMEAVQHKWL
jgi:hypothetical protein